MTDPNQRLEQNMSEMIESINRLPDVKETINKVLTDLLQRVSELPNLDTSIDNYTLANHLNEAFK